MKGRSNRLGVDEHDIRLAQAMLDDVGLVADLCHDERVAVIR